jgi:hypothetical protein
MISIGSVGTCSTVVSACGFGRGSIGTGALAIPKDQAAMPSDIPARRELRAIRVLQVGVARQASISPRQHPVWDHTCIRQQMIAGIREPLEQSRQIDPH